VGVKTGAARLQSRSVRTIECILFDSDGTLVDSEPLSFRLLAEMMAGHGAELDSEQLHTAYRGWKIGEVIEALVDEQSLDLPDDFETAFRARQVQCFEAELEPIPGVRPVLRSLSIPMAVVTSGPLHKVRKALELTGLDGFFGNNVFSAYDLGVWKPDPEIYRIAARRMGYPIHQCLAVEDSPIGLEAAATCGAVPVFLNRFGETSGYGNVIEIASMGELRRLVATFQSR
jgi:HAD superfamily hydrolase (TIGR01509 family)